MTILSSFNFSESIDDQVTSNDWINRLNVSIEDDYLTATNVGSLGTCFLSGITDIEFTFVPHKGQVISVSGVLLLGSESTFQVTWSPVDESIQLIRRYPLEDPDPEGEQFGETLESTPLPPDVEYTIKVTIIDQLATLSINDTETLSLVVPDSYQRVQVLCSGGTRFKDLTLSGD